MSDTYVLPNDLSLKGSLSMIYGQDPEILEDQAADFEPSHVANYANADGVVVAACLCDLSGAASLSCALSLIPVPTAEDLIQEGALSEIATENLNEVMNIFSALLMDDHSGHLRLHELQVAAPGAHDGMAEAMRAAHFRIGNVRYPEARVSFYVN